MSRFWIVVQGKLYMVAMTYRYHAFLILACEAGGGNSAIIPDDAASRSTAALVFFHNLFSSARTSPIPVLGWIDDDASPTNEPDTVNVCALSFDKTKASKLPAVTDGEAEHKQTTRFSQRRR